MPKGRGCRRVAQSTAAWQPVWPSGCGPGRIRQGRSRGAGVSRGVNKVDYQPPQNAGFQGASQNEDDEEQFDWEKIAGYARFVFGALRRHAFLALGTFMLVGASAYFIFWLLPRSYHIEAQLLAQKNQLIGQLAARGGQDQSHTKAAA